MLDAINMSWFGVFHTAIAVVAVACGIVALVRHGVIATSSRPGLAYVLLTVATCATGLFIFRHGTFGEPHVLAILTLAVLALAGLAERRSLRGGLWRYVAVPAYSLTLFFHLIPGLTETGTRIPQGNPAFSGPEDPMLRLLVGIGFLAYLVGATWQVLRMRRKVAARGLQAMVQ